MSGRVIGVLPDGTTLYVETGELEQFLLKHTTFLGRKLCHKSLMGVFRISGIHPPVFHILHALVELFARDVQGTAEIGRIELCHFAGYKGNVVSRLVEYKQLTVTVVDGSARRILYFIQESVAVGILLVIICHDLQIEEAQDINEYNNHCRQADYKLSFL